MILVDSPASSPGHCIITHSAVGPFCDTQIDLDDLPGYGRLYIGHAAIATMANMIGYVPSDRVVAAEDQLAAALDRITDLEAQIAGLEHVRDAVRSVAGLTADVELADDLVVPDDTEILEMYAEDDPPPDDVDSIMAWVDEDEATAEIRRRIAVHVESRKSETTRRKAVMSLGEVNA